MITSAVVSAWLWVHVGFLLVVVGYSACGYAMLPGMAERGSAKLATRPLLTTLIGLAISGPWVATSILLMSLPNGVLKFAGVLLGLTWLFVALVGMSAVSLHVGRRERSREARWHEVARGAGLVTLTWMLPLLGWFVALPLTLACGVGCMVAPAGRAALPQAA